MMRSPTTRRTPTLGDRQRENVRSALLRELRVRFPGRPVTVEWDEPDAITDRESAPALAPTPKEEPPYVFPGPSYQWTGLEGEYADVLLRDPCSYCGDIGDHRAVDHVVPRRYDGVHSWENLTAACRSCNASKRVKPLLTFLLWRASA